MEALLSAVARSAAVLAATGLLVLAALASAASTSRPTSALRGSMLWRMRCSFPVPPSGYCDHSREATLARDLKAVERLAEVQLPVGGMVSVHSGGSG